MALKRLLFTVPRKASFSFPSTLLWTCLFLVLLAVLRGALPHDSPPLLGRLHLEPAPPSLALRTGLSTRVEALLPAPSFP